MVRRTAYDASGAVDSDAVRSAIVDACGSHKSIRAAREAGEYVIPARDRIVEAMIPVACRMCLVLANIPSESRVRNEDVMQGAMLGLIEAIDSFEPSRGVKVETHAWMRIRYRVLEVVGDEHWVVMRPPRQMMRAFFGGGMSEDDRKRYSERVFGAEYVDEMNGDDDEA